MMVIDEADDMLQDDTLAVVEDIDIPNLLATTSPLGLSFCT
ncbi:hypothetical protein [Limosilactobacillus reuteri]|nr:hypothetical protein [Limosilactobacillus reuteri]